MKWTITRSHIASGLPTFAFMISPLTRTYSLSSRIRLRRAGTVFGAASGGSMVRFTSVASTHPSALVADQRTCRSPARSAKIRPSHGPMESTAMGPLYSSIGAPGSPNGYTGRTGGQSGYPEPFVVITRCHRGPPPSGHSAPCASSCLIHRPQRQSTSSCASTM